MECIFISTVVGPDSPGAIKSMAETTRSLGGEWLTSKVMKLDGQLTAMMKVLVDKEKEAELKAKLENQFVDLRFFYAEPIDDTKKTTEVINLVVDCKDRPGLTKDINTIAANLDLVVKDMDCNRYHVSSIGEAVFSARLTIGVPEGTSSQAVADEIEALYDDVRVSVR